MDCLDAGVALEMFGQEGVSFQNVLSIGHDLGEDQFGYDL
jgi:hypothetical protein